jgi:hypothetical protein
MILTFMLCHGSSNLKRALKGANNNICSGSQGMGRPEESNNELRLRKKENRNQNDSQMFSMNRAHTEMRKITMVEK